MVDTMSDHIDSLNLSVRTTNLLLGYNIIFLHDLIDKTEKELLKKSGFGRVAVNEIKSALFKKELQLKGKLIKPIIYKEILSKNCTLRDHFAGLAMAALIKAKNNSYEYTDLALESYMIADAMMDHTKRINKND